MFAEHYRAADTATRLYGLDWYTRARRTATTLALEYGRRTETVAAIMACVSQQVTWQHAQVLTVAALHGRRVPHYTQIQAKVARLLAGESPWYVLRGPKIRAFYHAIMGQRSAVVLDSWMIRAATGRRTCTAKQYKNLAATLRSEARAANLSPADFQAIVWCKVRGEWR